MKPKYKRQPSGGVGDLKSYSPAYEIPMCEECGKNPAKVLSKKCVDCEIEYGVSVAFNIFELNDLVYLVECAGFTLVDGLEDKLKGAKYALDRKYHGTQRPTIS